MALTEPHKAPAGDGDPLRVRPPRRRRALRMAALLGVVAAAAFTAGFVMFLSRVATEEIALKDRADGIAVLTGGASRVADGVELLASGHGKRLLITGVNRTTTANEIARITPQYRSLFNCCVDLDHSATNTVGNAVETKRWVKDKGFRSVIVVTSSYHMPRAMAELENQLPDVALIEFPVVTDRLRAEPWWQSPAIAKLLFFEYVKYMVAQVRMRLEPVPSATGVAGTGNRTRS